MGDLAPLLKEGLDVVFVGTEPGRESLRQSHYYADGTNSFYESLCESGWTARKLDPSEFRSLLDYGIGLDDVRGEPEELERRLAEVKPRAVCFNSKTALEDSCGMELAPDAWAGELAGTHATFSWGATVWAVHDSSGRAASYYRDRVQLLALLRERLDSVGL